MGVGSNIKKLLKEKNKTLVWLSGETGISKNTLYSITKRDSSRVDPDTLQKIADKLDVPPESLFWGESAKVTVDQNGDTVIDITYKRHLKQITRAFDALNVRGREEVIAFATDLAQMSRYTKPWDSFTKNEYMEMFPELFNEDTEGSPKLDTPTNNEKDK
ncbi:helix-turn-helix transcriptional regulator [Anaerotignum sp.]|uniref:helix-turn-helix domain-containing protein n=1 Tax=Anaerotignum sp. TaxID=2039241 RepID=UPI003332D057